MTIEPGNGSQITAQLVAAGKANIAYADAAPVMKLISSGAKMKILSTIFQGNPNQLDTSSRTCRPRAVIDAVASPAVKIM